MRARHRHFNPKAAGAVLALDSRYGFSVANGANIATWDDRSDTNDATDVGQTNRQPTYQTNQLNGQPVIRFDGNATAANADELRVVLATSITSNSLSCFSISLKTNAGRSSTQFSRIFSLSLNDAQDFNNTNSILFDQTEANGADLQIYRNSSQVTNIAANYGEYYLHSFTLNGTAVSSRKFGETATTGSTSATALNSNRVNIGGVRAFTPDSYLSGDIALITIITAVVSDALRKRLEHAAAFSFKQTCN